MFTLIAILTVVTLAAGAFFYVLALFLQGWYYTEPTPGILWRAPSAGAAMGVFFFFWCLLVYNSGARPGALPYDSLLRYSSEVALTREPVQHITAWYGAKKVEYTRRGANEYVEKKAPFAPWNPSGITKLEIKVGNETLTFTRGETNRGVSRTYVNEQGWMMDEYEGTVKPGPTGMPKRHLAGRGFANWLLNIAHGLCWFACFWLLLRFQWPHALLLAAALWLVMTIGVLPMMLDAAARAASGSDATAVK
jgi:hypothetical protein